MIVLANATAKADIRKRSAIDPDRTERTAPLLRR